MAVDPPHEECVVCQMYVCECVHILSFDDGEEVHTIICAHHRSHAMLACSHRTVSPAVVCAHLPPWHTPAPDHSDPSWGGWASDRKCVLVNTCSGHGNV